MKNKTEHPRADSGRSREAVGQVLKRLVPLLIVGAALVGVAALARWVVLSPKPQAPPRAEAPAVNVTVRVVRGLREMIDDFEVPAVVEANRVVRVSAEVSGRVEKVNCKEGEDCRPPDPEDKNPVPMIELNTELLQAEHDRAAAAAGLAAATYKRIAELAKEGGTTDQSLDEAESAMRVSEAAEKLAKAKLDRARIFPPIAGVLNDILVEKGEFVQSGQAVAEIVEIDKVKVVAPVPEHDIPFLRVNDRAVVLVDDRTNGEETVLSLAGAITYISKLADERTRATRVEIALDNKGRKLHSGRIVRVRFIRQVLRNVIMVPLSAVIPLENSKAVYVVETIEDEKGKRDVARRREVRLNTRFIRTEGDGGKAAVNGRRKQQMIQILAWPSGDGRRGLREGDRLIVAGHQFVAPGQRVIIRETVAGSGHKSGGDTPR